MLNTPSLEVFHGVFGSQLGDSVREVQYEDREEEIKISGFFSLSPHHTRNLQFFSVNISCCCLLHKEVHDLFRKVKTFQDWKSQLEYFSIYPLHLELSPLYCDFIYEERKTLVMFREKAKLMKLSNSS